MPYEYTRFGDKVMRREANSADDWQDVPAGDLQEAEIELRVAARLAAERRGEVARFSARIIRGGGTPN